MRFDPSVVTVKQLSVVSQIVSSAVVLSYLVLLDWLISPLYGAGSCWLRFSGVCSKLVNVDSRL